MTDEDMPLDVLEAEATNDYDPSEAEVRLVAFHAAMDICGFSTGEVVAGSAEDAVEIVTCAQIVYDFLTGDVTFDYDHVLEGEPEDEDEAAPSPSLN